MNNLRATRLIVAGAILIAFILFSISTFITIESGHKGILFRKFGGGLDLENVYGQGFHIIAPWNSMYIYDVREQIKEESMTVLSSDGLNIETDVSVRFRPVEQEVGYLHNEIGKNYADIIVRDLTRSTIRRIIGRYKPQEIYQSKREEIENNVQEELSKKLKAKHIVLESALLREIKLPKTIEDAIQNKLKAKQEADKIVFNIEREKKEAERLKIEATAKAEANRILSESLTDKLLREKGIEATKNLAKSNNSKIIVIGSGKDGLPIILNGN